MFIVTKKEFAKMVKRRAELFDQWADEPKHKDFNEFCKLTTIISYLESKK